MGINSVFIVMSIQIKCTTLSEVFLFCSALTEKIVAVLPEMKCPYHLEPHQIQGLDFIHIFPVIQVSIYCCKITF
jgi:hypothetical protein